MSTKETTYQELTERVRELQEEIIKLEKAEKRLVFSEKKYKKALQEKEIMVRNLLGLISTISVPRLYLDHKLNIKGFSDDFPILNKFNRLADSRLNLSEILRESDIYKIQRYLEKTEALKNLPYDKGLEWEIRYRGPSEADKIGKSWIVSTGCNAKRWKIIKDSGKLKISHNPHIREKLDCYLMSAQEFGGPDEDIKVVYRTKTSGKMENIRDLSLVLSGTLSRAVKLCDAAGYTICSGSSFNTEARIQRKVVDMISQPERLKPNTEYEITVERIGGRIRRLLKNLNTQEQALPLELIDSNALYDQENHIGFTTYSGEASFFDIEVFTRKSLFSIDQFRIPFDVEVELKDKELQDKVFKLKISREHFGPKSSYTLFFEDITDQKSAEQALRESREKYKELIENINDVIYMVDDRGVIKYISPVIETVLGYTPSEIIDRNFTDFLYQEDLPIAVKRFKKAMRGDIPIKDYRVATKSKEMRWIRTSTRPAFKENKVVGLQGVISDITERKKAVEALVESEKRYRQHIQNLPIGIYRNTPGPKGKFIMANQALARIHGFETVEELLQIPVADLYWEPKRRKVFIEKLIALGEVFREELQLKKRDGTPIWGAVTAKVIHDESGKIMYFDGMLEDITRQKQAEEALQISEERFRNIAGETDDWIWEIGKDLVIKYSNSRVKDILGYKPEEVVGRSLLDFLSEEELSRMDMGNDYLLREVIFTGQETYLVHKDGHIIITESSGVPIFRRNRTFIGFQGLTRDITERVRAREEEELRRKQLIQADKMISLGILVSGVAHEINNPNQFIMVNAPMLKRAWENITPILDKYYEDNGDFMLAGISYKDMRDRIPNLFSGIYEGAQRIRHIVRNLKDYAREVGSETTREVDINAVLKSALTILSNLLKKSTKNLKVIYADNLPTVRGNFQQIEQVLINLIQNACQALTDPMQEILISTSFNKKNKNVVIKIKDEGVGIPEDKLKYILDPFFTTKRDSGGTGLGLSISAGIIQDHGGRLEFSSKPGKGTTVLVSLPVSSERESLSI
ncbi:MAG TPA: PAS domain S-box protein [archaeon]|nr:PAS domain S-box protein [archaeon]